MKQVEFESKLKELRTIVEGFIKEPKQGIVFPRLDEAKLDMGQQTIWQRTGYFEFDYLEDEWDHCSACIDVLKGSAHFCIDTIDKYLARKYTEPRQVRTATYMKNDRSESVSAMFQLTDGRPEVISVQNEISDGVQQYFDAHNQPDVELANIKVPTKIGSYTLEKNDVSLGVLFHDELPKNTVTTNKELIKNQG